LKPTILIVDDEPGVRSALGGVLRDEGYAVEAVASGEECLERVTRGGIDLIMLDVWLPGMDGLATFARLRERQVDAEVVIISGHGTVGDALRATREGAWTKVRLEAQAPQNASAVTLQLYLSNAPQATVWWDDIALEEIPEPAPRKTTVSSVELTVDDLAVVEIARFAGPAALQRLSRLDGLQVDASGPLMVGETDGRTGVAWGYSGSAAVDQEGHVVGVLTSADFRGRVSVNLATIQEAKTGGRPIDVATTLPDRSLVVVEPLQDPGIIDELQQARVPSESRRTIKVVFAGFPSASCASTSARLHAATSPAGAELLGKWGAMDESDAWRIPPRFSIRTVSFSYR